MKRLMLSVVALASSPLAFAQPASSEVKLLDGSVVKGEVLSLSATEVKLKAGNTEQSLPLDQVISVDLQPPARNLPPNQKYLKIRLNDGSVFQCAAFGMKGPNAELRLFSGQSLMVPVHSLHWVLCEAQNRSHATEFEELLRVPAVQDRVLLLSRDGAVINTFEGFVGAANADGTALSFKLGGGSDQVELAMSRIRGIIYSRDLGRFASVSVACKLYDQYGNAIVAGKLEATENGFRVTTPVGVVLSYPWSLVQRLDLSMGKLAYLSDLEPTRVEEQPLLADIWKYRRDKNLEGGPISVGRKTYAKGLTVHSRTVLEYDVTGYNLFRCIVGIDDTVNGPAHAVVRIEADGKELFSSAVTSKDKPRNLELKINGATRLRLIVDYGDDLDLGDHVVFAEARVTK